MYICTPNVYTLSHEASIFRLSPIVQSVAAKKGILLRAIASATETNSELKQNAFREKDCVKRGGIVYEDKDEDTSKIPAT